MKELQNLLNLQRWADCEESSGGLLAKRRPDIAKLAYEISANRGLSGRNLEKLLEFAKPVPASLPRRLFSLCNGLRVGATKFTVYGVLPSDDLPDPINFEGLPVDINVPNLYGRPPNLNKDYFIVAASSEYQGAFATEFVHFMTAESVICVAPYSNPVQIARCFESVDDWICSEFDRAIREQHHF